MRDRYSELLWERFASKLKALRVQLVERSFQFYRLQRKCMREIEVALTSQSKKVFRNPSVAPNHFQNGMPFALRYFTMQISLPLNVCHVESCEQYTWQQRAQTTPCCCSHQQQSIATAFPNKSPADRNSPGDTRNVSRRGGRCAPTPEPPPPRAWPSFLSAPGRGHRTQPAPISRRPPHRYALPPLRGAASCIVCTH